MVGCWLVLPIVTTRKHNCWQHRKMCNLRAALLFANNTKYLIQDGFSCSTSMRGPLVVIVWICFVYSDNKLKNQKSHGNSKLILIRVAVNTDFGQSGRCLLRLPRIFCHTLHKTIDVVTLKNLQTFFSWYNFR